jgi:hypothetical protein
MRARTFFFALLCGTATAALAQDGGYVRFPSASPQACSIACAGDQMCASWSFGTAARSYGQSQTRSESAGMCTFSGSSVVRNAPGMVSGLPRRESVGASVPMMSAPPQMGQQSYPMQATAPQGSRPNNQNSSNDTGWGVRPAPWLSNSGTMAPSNVPPVQARQQVRNVPPLPSVIPPTGPRIEFETPAPTGRQPTGPAVLTPPQRPFVAPAPAVAQPAYVPPAPPPVARVAPKPPEPLPSAPFTIAPARGATRVQPMAVPAPPPGTRELSGNPGLEPSSTALSSIVPPSAVPPRPRAARGVPVARPSRPAPPSASPAQTAPPEGNQVSVTLPTRAPVVAVAAPTSVTPEVRDLPSANAAPSTPATPVSTPTPVARATPAARVTPTIAVARGTPRVSRAATTSTPASATTPVRNAPAAAAPPRQETAARGTTGRTAPRPPVRDPFNPESFRGADGMIDSAEMRRAQLNAAREQGTPAYSVQREWEAVAAERQRAEDAGEVRVDPLAGTSPVAPPPETRAERRAREAEEAVIAAEEARDAIRANGGEAQDPAPATQRAPAARPARGVPRPKSARQTSQNDTNQQVATRSQRRAPAQALDREPRLSGGPG